MPYLFSEFKEWLTANPDQRGEFANWDAALFSWSDEDTWKKVLRKFSKKTPNSPVTAQAIQQWLIDKDNHSPTRETTLNRWQILHYRVINNKYNQEKKLTQMRDTINELVANKRMINNDKIILNLNSLTDMKQKLEDLISN